MKYLTVDLNKAEYIYDADFIRKSAIQYLGWNINQYKVECLLGKFLLEQIKKNFEEPLVGEWVLDTRVHQLKRGWYPCIPGWHFDFMPRFNGKVTHSIKVSAGKLFMFILDFGTGSMATIDPESWERASNIPETYNDLNNWYRWGTEFVTPRLVMMKNHTIYQLDRYTAHKGTPAVDSGWRYFFRLAHIPNKLDGASEIPIFNEIRHQTQVYVPTELIEVGW